MPVRPAKSWSSTLRLPRSSFPPRTTAADQTKYLKRCTDDLYTWQAQNRIGSTQFVLHDGPPYANGSLHVGHALNKILKDIICRSELKRGKHIRYVPGWDCHGLPIEIKVLENQQEETHDGEKLDAVGIRRAARNLAARTVREQKKGFRGWAIMADWDNTWTTMDRNFELKQLGVFREMTKKGIVFRRNKPVYWSPSSRTALAEAELEYKDDHESKAAFVKFPISVFPEVWKDQGVGIDRLSAVIWTTTPWTLPANRAIAVHPSLNYVVVQCGNEQLLVAEARLEHIAKECSLDVSDRNILVRIQGSDLRDCKYMNVLNGHQSSPQPIIFADFVSAESGSGLVHCAPGHGMEDYDVCTNHGIAAYAPVDDAGCFTDAAFPEDPAALAGEPVLGNGTSKVISLLGDKVLVVNRYVHKYPYDWRTKLPVIVRATEQWFADVGSIKGAALKSLEAVDFIPITGRSRLQSFITGRSEWCISRQRAWGVPIPALYDESGVAILTDESVAHIISVIKERGSDAWWTDPEGDPSWVVAGLQGSYRRGKDTMDVWFDSGSSWMQTEGLADVYCEGTDQHRGWFQSSLLTHLSASGLKVAPFRKVITHGFTLDQDSRKMSKSIGNVIAPNEIMKGTLLPPVKRKGKAAGSPEFDGLGPDALRLWVASSDYTRDVVIGQPVLQSINNSLLKYRTTIRMLLGSMHEEAQNLSLSTLDKIALVQLDKVMIGVWEAWQGYEFHKAVNIINRWVNTDLSSFYLEGIKDRLYCGDGGGVLHHVFQGFLQMLAPITPVLVEESWEHRPEWLKQRQMTQHPSHQVLNPQRPLQLERSLYYGIEEDIPWILNANTAIKTAQEEARSAKLIGSSLQSSIVLVLPEKAQGMFKQYEHDLEAIFVVSSVEIGVEVEGHWKFSAQFDAPGGKGVAWVLPPNDAKCPRCWRYVAATDDEICKRCEDIVGL